MEICEEGNSTISNETHYDVVDVNGDEEHESNDNHDHDHDDQLTKQEVDPTTTTIVENLEGLDLQENGQSTNLEKEKEKEVKTQKYPLRNNAIDCVYYTKTGSCKYGSNCMFNHSVKKVFKVVGEKEKEKEKVAVEEKNESVSDSDKTECKYFSTPGGCKYGDTCKYAHITKKVEEEAEGPGPELNFLGLPIRPLEKECTFFMRHGICGYGASCVFHHPNPSLAKEFDSDISKTREAWDSSEVSQDTNSRNTSIDSYHQGTTQIYERNDNQVGQVNMTSNKPSLPHEIVKTGEPEIHHNEHLMHIEEFPERPGQPDCDYFLRAGDCKYRSACRYNHPLTRVRKVRLPPFSAKDSRFRSAKVSPLDSTDFPYSKSNNTRKNEPFHHPHQQQMQNSEYPERPGQPECEYFMKNGDCKFKSYCRYHHPRNRVSSSSLSKKGLPLRPGIKVCRYFQQSGTCKYGRTCQFHHPDDFAKTFALEDRSFTAAKDIPINNNDGSEWGDTWVI